MRKPRSDSRLYRLSDAQRAKLLDWLRTNMHYSEAVQLVRREFGVITSEAAVSKFFSQNMEGILRPPIPTASVGICVTVTCNRPGEMILAFDAPPPQYGPEKETTLAAVPATVRSAGVRVVSLADSAENRVRLVAYPLPPLDAPVNREAQTTTR